MWSGEVAGKVWRERSYEIIHKWTELESKVGFQGYAKAWMWRENTPHDHFSSFMFNFPRRGRGVYRVEFHRGGVLQLCVKAQSVDSAVRPLGFASWFCHFAAIRSWTICLLSLCFRFHLWNGIACSSFIERFQAFRRDLLYASTTLSSSLPAFGPMHFAIMLTGGVGSVGVQC